MSKGQIAASSHERTKSVLNTRRFQLQSDADFHMSESSRLEEWRRNSLLGRNGASRFRKQVSRRIDGRMGGNGMDRGPARNGLQALSQDLRPLVSGSHASRPRQSIHQNSLIGLGLSVPRLIAKPEDWRRFQILIAVASANKHGSSLCRSEKEENMALGSGKKQSTRVGKKPICQLLLLAAPGDWNKSVAYGFAPLVLEKLDFVKWSWSTAQTDGSRRPAKRRVSDHVDDTFLRSSVLKRRLPASCIRARSPAPGVDVRGRKRITQGFALGVVPRIQLSILEAGPNNQQDHRGLPPQYAPAERTANEVAQNDSILDVNDSFDSANPKSESGNLLSHLYWIRYFVDVLDASQLPIFLFRRQSLLLPSAKDHFHELTGNEIHRHKTATLNWETAITGSNAAICCLASQTNRTRPILLFSSHLRFPYNDRLLTGERQAPLFRGRHLARIRRRFIPRDLASLLAAIGHHVEHGGFYGSPFNSNPRFQNSEGLPVILEPVQLASPYQPQSWRGTPFRGKDLPPPLAGKASDTTRTPSRRLSGATLPDSSTSAPGAARTPEVRAGMWWCSRGPSLARRSEGNKLPDETHIKLDELFESSIYGTMNTVGAGCRGAASSLAAVSLEVIIGYRFTHRQLPLVTGLRLSPESYQDGFHEGSSIRSGCRSQRAYFDSLST
ncbi:hypothetical protein CCUS01_02981 [Colletotrichum cuscutae]|uniref:Uncharacterized protein n=1 Tax=Colletotrichum cuscutae TaxID=1209917 RepID=A0AAJ0DMR1_9PEZI|nr:hypothetical protein CCUS01_02981 [Colletotrichum cuscutae]